jgi:NAD(P)H-hydrate epimerase
MLYLTRNQVREIDRRAVEQYKIPGIVLMENAARAAADVAVQMLADHPGKVSILCGGGNNGGDGLALARHLHNRGIELSITLTADPTKYKAEALANWQIVRAMSLPVTFLHRPTAKPALIVDAIFGTGLTQAPRVTEVGPPYVPFPDLCRAIEESQIPVLAIDLPSGMDCDTGRPLGSCIRATRTITFVAQKIGFAQPAAQEYLGQITVGDIGCPTELIERVASGK